MFIFKTWQVKLSTPFKNFLTVILMAFALCDVPNAIMPPKKVTKERKPWIPGINQDPDRRRHYEWRMIAFGIACIIGAFYINFDNLLTTEKSLAELHETIKNSDVIVDNVSSRNRMGYEAKSRRATLYFSLNEH